MTLGNSGRSGLNVFCLLACTADSVPCAQLPSQTSGFPRPSGRSNGGSLGNSGRSGLDIFVPRLAQPVQ